MSLISNIKKTKYLNFLTTKKIINSKIFNILGLQIFRYALTKFIYFLSSFYYKDNYFKKYYRDGYYLIENFLSEEQFLKLKEEFNKIIEEEEELRNTYEDNDTEINSSIKYLLYEFEDNDKNKNLYPELYDLYKSEKINYYFRGAERKKNPLIFMRLERVITKDELRNDSNNHWHVDTYHDTHKAWVYLTDVSTENGPFNYLKGSGRFSFKRILWEYLNSIRTLFDKKYLSFFSEKKLSNRLEKNKIEVICSKNSFLMANTHGYHRRGNALKGKIRDAISFCTRENPYKLF